MSLVVCNSATVGKDFDIVKVVVGNDVVAIYGVPDLVVSAVEAGRGVKLQKELQEIILIRIEDLHSVEIIGFVVEQKATDNGKKPIADNRSDKAKGITS